jgi:hypothetical protein
MKTRSETVRRRLMITAGLAVILLAQVFLLYLVDLYVVPLGELLAIAAEKAGFESLAERLRPGTLG